ncbi:MAG: cytochrome P450 [Deltaproteobacteria bacterium]|nr:cytochrome P450 [Deltaproteobacteria bacterium]
MEPAFESATRLFGGSMMSPIPDPYPVYRQLRRDRPVVMLDGQLGRVALISRYDDVAAALKDSAVFSARGNARGIGMVMGRTILEMEGAEHLRQRRLVTPAFSPRTLREGLDVVVENVIERLVDGFAGDGKADLVSQLTFTFPLRVMAHVMALPIDDFDQFHHWAIDLLSIADDPQRGFDAAAKIVDYLRPILEERRRDPGSDLISTLLHADVEGERLTEEEVLSFLRLLLPAGAETTYRLTGSLLHALLTHPEAHDEVRSDPAGLDRAIEETLRWEAAVQYVSRETTRAVEVAETTIGPNELVMLAIGSANRDGAHFEDPDRFVLGRRSVGDHLAFGFGEHFCLGSNLARLEARTAVRILFDRLPNLRLAPDADCRIVGLAFRSPDRLPVVFG